MSRLSCLHAVLLAPLCVVSLAAQVPTGTIRVEVRAGDQPVAGAEVTVGATTARTGDDGAVVVVLPPGPVTLRVSQEGFAPATARFDVVAGAERTVRIDLVLRPDIEEEVTVVASTRSDRRLDETPVRVEVLQREEIEEKMLMTPGDIVMMLNEMGGLRVQATSPSLGAASVRIQGLRGRYTRFLSDGLPVFGEQPGGLGLLQIPPMDLGRVEVIKGAASALYGAGALGGVVNLLSRRPGPDPEHEVLFNRSTRGATDAVLWLSAPLADQWGATLLAGGHWQDQTDVDADGWADLAGYRRGVVRPRLFWNNTRGGSLFATAGFTTERRTGGTMAGRTLPAAGTAYVESLGTTRVDAGLVVQTLVKDRFVVAARAAAARDAHDHRFGEAAERDRHESAFGEATLRGRTGPHTWVAGAAVSLDRYRALDVPGVGYRFRTTGVFVQDELDVTGWLAASGSVRLDYHSAYGRFLSPRVAVLARAAGWEARASAGSGFFGPTPLTEDTEAAGLSRLRIDGPLRAERGRTLSFDLTRHAGPGSYTVTLFSSRIRDPIAVDPLTYTLTRAAQADTAAGLELLAALRREPVALTASYTFVRTRHGPARADMPLTPRHSAGLVAMIESEERGRLGVEVYVTGRQRLEANPFRATSHAYVVVGLLAERRFGRVSLFVNGENLTNARQTRWDPLLRPDRAADGRWTVDVWAPVEGRVVNGGIRIKWGR